MPADLNQTTEKTMRTAVACCLLMFLVASPCRAQTGAAPAGEPGDAPPARTAGPTAPPRNPAELLRESGGSLLRASLAAGPGDARSLNATSFFAVPAPEPRVIRRHDLVTVIIREQSEFSADGSTETKRDAKLQAQINQFIKLNWENFAIENAIGDTKPKIDVSGKRDFSGEGTVERTDSFTARITAEVVDVKPNGNVVLAARKRIVTDSEERVFLLAGIARAQDITADNTVLSTQLYDLDVRQQNAGAVRAATERGAVPRLLDQLNLW